MITKKPLTTEMAMEPIFGEASSFRMTTGSLEGEVSVVLVVEGDGHHGVVD